VSESNPNIITCDKCKIDASSDKEIFEYQEFLRVRFRGGYGSVFLNINYSFLLSI